MDIYVLDTDFSVKEVIDDYLSIIWTRRYYGAGDFELYVSAAPNIINLLQRGRYLVRAQDMAVGNIYRNVMIIEDIELVTDVEDGDKLIVTGHDLKYILHRRVISKQTTVNATFPNGILQLLNENIIEPTTAGRTILNFAIGDRTGVPTTQIKRQFTGTNLYEAVMDLCVDQGTGFDVYLNNGTFVFDLYYGSDRSYDQDTLPHVTFSDEYDNLISSDYTVDGSAFANVAYVAGEGEGTARKIVTVGAIRGLGRYETWIDSRNTSSNDGEISDADYFLMLSQEGLEALAEAAIITTFEGEVIDTAGRKFGTDFFLGDFVQVENDYGISSKVRITEAIESEDDNGAQTVLAFSVQ